MGTRKTARELVRKTAQKFFPPTATEKTSNVSDTIDLRLSDKLSNTKSIKFKIFLIMSIYFII